MKNKIKAMTTLEQLTERRNEIAKLIEVPESNLSELRSELDLLETRENEINKEVELRSELLSRVASTKNGIIIQPQGGEIMDNLEVRKFDLESPEYRSAFFNNLAGNTLTEIEQRAFVETTTTFGGALPKVTADKIWSNLQRDHSILKDIQVYSLGALFEVTVAKSVIQGKGKKTAEATANTVMKVEYGKHTLSGSDYTAWTEISYATGTMNGQDLEDFLITEIYEQIGDAIAEDIINGIITDTHADNKVELALVDFENLAKVYGKVKQKGAIHTYLNNTALYEHLVSMTNANGDPIFQPNANIKAEGAFIGSTLRTESAVENNQLIIGVPKAIVGNWVTKPIIERDKDIKAHTHVFSGYARFEAKLRNDLAFVIVTVKEETGA